MPDLRSLTATAAAAAAVAALGLGFLPAGATAAPQPAVDAAFTPTLTYVPCPAGEKLPPRTRCATLRVPLDWQTPDDGRTVLIAMRVTTPRRDAGRMGLTWNPGGPGGKVIEDLVGFYALLPASVRDRFDFVSWDPRGIGLSEPKLAGCTPANVGPPSTGPVDWDAFWAEVAATTGAATAACFAANPDAAPYLGTWQVVRDMEAMRAALGYGRWNYWGMSYGTRIGNTYARTFPDRLRAFIQDGPLMANETLGRFGSTLPSGVYESVQIYASLVGKRQAYKIRATLGYLDDTVIDVGEAEITRWGYLAGVRSQLLSQSNYPQLREFVNAVYDLTQVSDAVERKRVERGVRRAQARLVADPASDSFLITLVNCADLSERPTPQDVAGMARQAERNYGTAYGVLVFNAQCFGLPAGYSPASSNGDTTVSLRTPPLYLTTTGDPATPWVWGRSLANTYARSRTVTYDSTQHVSYFITPSECVNSVSEQYLLTLRLPRTDIFCPYVPNTTATN